MNNIINKLNTKNHHSIKSNLLSIGFNNLSFNKNISPKINTSLRINDSKSKKKQKDGNNFYNYKNTLIQKLTKMNLSHVRLLKKKCIQNNNNENKKKLD